MTQSKARRVHVNRRAQERYGVTMTDRIYEKLLANIQEGKFYRCAVNRFNGCESYLIKLRGQKAIAVYDPKRMELVTFLYCRDNPNYAPRKPQFDFSTGTFAV